MGWSWRICRIAGIDVYVHATFALLLLWVGYASYQPRHSVNDVLAGLAFILCLFGIIVLHELGHALTARRFGIKTRDITLLPIGGVARLERMPEDPKQELLVALAGPAVNAVLAGLLFVVLLVGDLPLMGPEEMGSFSGNLVGQLFLVNVGLALFNLLPAFPMDGGRVFRAILAMRLDYVRATRIAAGVGQMMAIGFGLLALFGQPDRVNPFLLVIALFIWVGAAAEAGAVQLKAGLAGVPVSRVVIRTFATLTPDDTLATAANRVLEGFQHDFPVVSDGAVAGVLLRNQLLVGLAEAGPDGRVGDFMEPDFQTVDPREMVEVAIERAKAGPCPVLPVVRNDELVGLLTLENVAELVTMREAIRNGRDLGQPVSGG